MIRGLILLTLVAAFSARCATEGAWSYWNAYTVAANQWAAMRNARLKDPARTGTIDATEVREWQHVKQLGHIAEHAIDAEYQGQ